MHRRRLKECWLGIVLGVFGWACAVHTPPPPLSPPSVSSVTQPTEPPTLLVEARRRFEEGRRALEQHRYDEAKRAFDEAAWLLLSVPRSSPLFPEAQSLLDEITEFTVNAEQALQARGIGLGEYYEPAIIDAVKDVHVFVSREEVADVRGWVRERVLARFYDLPVEVNEAVVEMIKAFQTVRRREFERGLQRLPLLLPVYRQMMIEAGLPADLAYLALIESGFNPWAYSRARARGVWQFIAQTARRYGLRITWWLDERSDIVRSAEAAIAYLKDLYAEFGDWWLALAAYNVGERRIAQAIERAGVRDFWTIRRLGLIPRETRNYVPAFIGALLIAKDPERFGFTIPPAPPLVWEEVPCRGGLSLRQIAAATGIPYETLRFLNAGLRRSYIPAGVTYRLRVPKGQGVRVAQVLERLPRRRYRGTFAYRVRRGDTLYRIARRFGVSVQELARWNRLQLRSIIRVGQVLYIPSRGGVRSRSSTVRVRGTKLYRIRPGDTLYDIARRLGVPTRLLIRMNPGVSPRRLRVGQVIRIPAQVIQIHARVPSRPGEIVHRVRPGDTLYGIARRYGVPLQRLLRYNGLTAWTPIYPGDMVRIPIGEVREADSEM